MNFLNCPSELFDTSADCKAVKTFVETEDKCGKKFGETFVMNYRFWHQDEDNNDDATAYENGLTTTEIPKKN